MIDTRVQMYGNILYFRYAADTSCRHYVFDIEAAVFFPASDLMIWCHYAGNKPFEQDVRKFDAVHPCTEKLVKNFIVPGKNGKYPASVAPAVSCDIVVMSDTTVLAAELLVRPAIADLLPTLQTSGHIPLSLLAVFHDSFCMQIWIQRSRFQTTDDMFFLFLYNLFPFFMNCWWCKIYF